MVQPQLTSMLLVALPPMGEGSGSSGGGLNGSVKSYADALKLASESLSEIASAYSIKALDSRISSLEGGSATTISVSGSGNAVTSITKNGTTISVVKGSTFLTSHQSLDGYVNNITTSGTGNAITSVTKSGKTVTFTKGVTFLTSHQSLSAYLKSADAANTYSKLGHTHSSITGAYTNNGGQQNPNYFGTNKIGGLMMNTIVNGNNDYKDWLILDCYSGNDAGGAVAIGINRLRLGAYIMQSEATRKTWKNSAELLGTHNYSSYVSPKTHTHSVKINGSTKIIAASGGTAVDLGTYLTSHQSLAGYATQDWVNTKGYITSSASISGNAATATKLQTSRNLWGNSFNGTENIGGTILPSATHTYNLGSATYMFERTYTRYIETDSRYDLRLICAGNELIRLGSSDNVVYFNSQGLSIKNDVNSGCFMAISEIRDSELNYGQINVVDTNGYRPKGRHLVLQYEQGNVGIGVKYPSEKLEVNGNILVNTSNTSGDIGLKIKANSRNLLFGVGTSTKIGVYSYSDRKWLFYTDTSTFYTSGGILATGGVTAYSSSDIRLKQDLRKLDFFGIIKAMGGTFGFAWKKDNTRSIGWIAQHVLCNPHLKDIVETDENGYYKINYWSPKLIATAFGAIEQVGDEISRLKARVVFLESEVQRLSGKQDGNNKKRLDNKNINLLN